MPMSNHCFEEQNEVTKEMALKTLKITWSKHLLPPCPGERGQMSCHSAELYWVGFSPVYINPSKQAGSFNKFK